MNLLKTTKNWIEVSENEVKEKNLECYEDEVDYKKRFYIQVDKYGNPTSGKNKDYTVAKNELQNEKELYILQKFFNYADRCGLKVNTNKFTRALIHPTSQLHPPKLDEIFYDYPEIISLAQHYGLPTKALDWSYDYKVSLYLL